MQTGRNRDTGYPWSTARERMGDDGDVGQLSSSLITVVILEITNTIPSLELVSTKQTDVYDSKNLATAFLFSGLRLGSRVSITDFWKMIFWNVDKTKLRNECDGGCSIFWQVYFSFANYN